MRAHPGCVGQSGQWYLPLEISLNVFDYPIQAGSRKAIPGLCHSQRSHSISALKMMHNERTEQGVSEQPSPRTPASRSASSARRMYSSCGSRTPHCSMSSTSRPVSLSGNACWNTLGSRFRRIRLTGLGNDTESSVPRDATMTDTGPSVLFPCLPCDRQTKGAGSLR